MSWSTGLRSGPNRPLLDNDAPHQIPGITLDSRIVFVCDAFHAMTTDRPYRQALPESEAIRRLKLSAGTQFDPAIVRTFVRLHGAGKTTSTSPARADAETR
jgi:HD-GYP domain-containing protein (c-di-GMP phosphodiesterase class II)